MKELVEYLARLLVAKPESVSVVETQRQGGAALEIQVPSSELGRLIGREGSTAKAIRTVVNAAAARKRRYVAVEIVEKKGP